jgi:hypothetical protein
MHHTSHVSRLAKTLVRGCDAVRALGDGLACICRLWRGWRLAIDLAHALSSPFKSAKSSESNLPLP